MRQQSATRRHPEMPAVSDPGAVSWRSCASEKGPSNRLVGRKLKRFQIKAGAGSTGNERIAFRTIRRTTPFGIHDKTPFPGGTIYQEKSLRLGLVALLPFYFDQCSGRVDRLAAKRSSPVYASRCPTQNSGPSGSLLLSRRTLAFPASCRLRPGTDSATWRQLTSTTSGSASGLPNTRWECPTRRDLARDSISTEPQTLPQTPVGGFAGRACYGLHNPDYKEGSPSTCRLGKIPH